MLYTRICATLLHIQRKRIKPLFQTILSKKHFLDKETWLVGSLKCHSIDEMVRDTGADAYCTYAWRSSRYLCCLPRKVATWFFFFMACLLKPRVNRTKGFLGAKCVMHKLSHRTLCVKGGSISLMWMDLKDWKCSSSHYDVFVAFVCFIFPVLVQYSWLVKGKCYSFTVFENLLELFS